jgi:predicted Rossmann fold nucleotide-binding protein DprA/Smf involved in DNA uptake
VEEHLQDRKALSDELERLKAALSRLEGGIRSRVDGRRHRERPVTQRTTAPAQTDASPARNTNPRAPRGENKTKILAALKGRPKTATEIATETGIKAGTVSALLSKLAKACDVVKTDPGYALPK